MTRSELARQVAERAGLSTSKATDVTNVLLETILDSLSRGEEVRLTGFGTFRVTERREREARHPRTGEKITVPAGRRLVFSPSGRLTEALQSKGAAGTG